jgi:TRAP-type C4-dicarboxylate transport system substrate-binding protein
MMRTLRFSGALVALGMVLAPLTGGPAAAKTTWDYQLFTGVTHPITIYLKGFADEVRKRTEGELDIIVRPAGELPFGATEVVKVVGDGLVQMGSAYAGFISGTTPKAAVSGIPFLVRTYAELDKTWPIIREYADQEFKRFGVMTLFYFSWPPQNIYGTGKPIHVLEDFSGRKLRTTDPKQAEMLRLLNATSVTLTTAEVPAAMERKVMEGVATAAFNTVGAKWAEFVEWGWMPDMHIGGPNYELVNINAFNALPSKVRETLAQVAAEWEKKMLREIAQEEQHSRDILRDRFHVKLYYPDQAQITELTRRMESYWASWAQEQGPDGIEMMRRLRAALGK